MLFLPVSIWGLRVSLSGHDAVSWGLCISGHAVVILMRVLFVATGAYVYPDQRSCCCHAYITSLTGGAYVYPVMLLNYHLHHWMEA